MTGSGDQLEETIEIHEGSLNLLDVQSGVPIEEEEPQVDLPSCPDHAPSTFVQGKPRSILDLPMLSE
jgi:hypothetical protein